MCPAELPAGHSALLLPPPPAHSTHPSPIRFYGDRAEYLFQHPSQPKQVKMVMWYADMTDFTSPAPGSTANAAAPVHMGASGLPWLTFRIPHRLREFKRDYDPTNAAHCVAVQLATPGGVRLLWDSVLEAGLLPPHSLSPGTSAALGRKQSHRGRSLRVSPATKAPQQPPLSPLVQPNKRADLHEPKRGRGSRRLQRGRQRPGSRAAGTRVYGRRNTSGMKFGTLLDSLDALLPDLPRRGAGQK